MLSPEEESEPELLVLDEAEPSVVDDGLCELDVDPCDEPCEVELAPCEVSEVDELD